MQYRSNLSKVKNLLNVLQYGSGSGGVPHCTTNSILYAKINGETCYVVHLTTTSILIGTVSFGACTIYNWYINCILIILHLFPHCQKKLLLIFPPFITAIKDMSKRDTDSLSQHQLLL